GGSVFLKSDPFAFQPTPVKPTVAPFDIVDDRRRIGQRLGLKCKRIALQKNTTRLETELEKSRKLNPNAQNNTDSDLEAWRNGTNWLANLPESTVGTTYKGGI
ncbi:MAG TPA: hypothetical protein P5207_07110, partial [Candidatus Sabulitectum sp.]|nr:hypothetical protein [Candidatus Sabulitectum sp.]